jgi:uncharacterized protein (TIGR02646 family)
MRQINKGAEPGVMTAWKAANRALPNYCYASLSAAHRDEIRTALVAEQRGLCAYTGRRIENSTCHIEHLRPQCHCGPGEDVDYRNLVAGVPAPNTPRLPYGAHKKDSWPPIPDEYLFVSPLSGGCGTRFSYNLKGEVLPARAGDGAASETIDRLGLNDPALVQLRKAAIDATLQIRGQGPASIDVGNARRRLRALAQVEEQAGPLEPFSFVLVQALERQIRRIENIRGGRRRI